MSENTNTGCGLSWILSTLIIVGTFLVFAGGTVSLSASQTTMITPTPENLNPYFVVENNEISYTQFPTLGEPCYYMISGHVLNANGDPFTNFVVNIKMADIEGVAPETGYSFPGDGAFAEDGSSGYATLLPEWQVSYEIWLTTAIGGEELSPHIFVPARDCDQNRAIANFVQTMPLP